MAKRILISFIGRADWRAVGRDLRENQTQACIFKQPGAILRTAWHLKTHGGLDHMIVLSGWTDLPKQREHSQVYFEGLESLTKRRLGLPGSPFHVSPDHDPSQAFIWLHGTSITPVVLHGVPNPVDHVALFLETRKELRRLEEARVFGPGDKLILQVNSGTPAMIMALHLLQYTDYPSASIYSASESQGVREANFPPELLHEIHARMGRHITERYEKTRRDFYFHSSHVSMQGPLKRVDLLAGSEAPLLLVGETGTGKTALARSIHKRSARGEGPFSEFNCSTFRGDLARSELFGHVKGAFTGAHKNHEGAFVAAHGGTLFLDEIGEMTLEVQAMLLTALDTGEIRPVGSAKPKKVDVRLLCATNKDLIKMIHEGTFRQDLFHRIALVHQIELAPLRKRPREVQAFATQYISYLNEHARLGERELGPEALEWLMQDPWPDNIRGLRGTLTHAHALRALEDDVIGVETLETVRSTKVAHAILSEEQIREWEPPKASPLPWLSIVAYEELRDWAKWLAREHEDIDAKALRRRCLWHITELRPKYGRAHWLADFGMSETTLRSMQRASPEPLADPKLEERLHILLQKPVPVTLLVDILLGLCVLEAGQLQGHEEELALVRALLPDVFEEITRERA